MIKLKRILVTIAAMTPLAFASVAYAVSVPSDYAQDVQDGNSLVSSDPTAKSQQNEVKDGENTEGQVDDGDVQIDETISDQENDMDDSQQGEANDSQDSSDEKDSDTSSQDSDEENGSSSETSTGTNN